MCVSLNESLQMITSTPGNILAGAHLRVTVIWRVQTNWLGTSCQRVSSNGQNDASATSRTAKGRPILL